MTHYTANMAMEQADYRLLAIIVNRGKAEKVFQLARKNGLTKANCLFAQGRSAAPNHLLELLALDEVDKEVVLLGIRKQDEENFFSQLEDKLQICKPHRGIAFTIPIIHPGSCGDSYVCESPYRCAMIILNEDVADDFSDFVRKNGYSGLTTIKAKGAASIMHPLMEMKVESAKVLMLMLVHRSKMDHLIQLVTENFNLNDENTGVMAVLPISNLTGVIFRREPQNQSCENDESIPVTQHMMIASVPHGKAEDYVQGVQKLGVSGSTILHSRFTDLASPIDSSIFPLRMDAEEEMVITLASRSVAHNIRHHLSLLEFKNQVEKPYAISLPVVRTQGVRAEEHDGSMIG